MIRTIAVEVAFARPDQQCVFRIQVESGCTARQAVCQSGIAGQFPGLDVNAARLGIFAKALDDPDQYVLTEGDRVEIYRPLIMDPKEARRKRAEKSRRTPG